jgi:hypothetical protein
MKKLFMLLPLAALVFASCSSDNFETEDANIAKYPEGAIWFSTGIDATRALTTTANFRQFNVTGLHSEAKYAFTNLAVSSENGTVWSYNTGDTDNPYKYWPADNTDVKFFAYSPASLQAKTTISDAYGKKITGFQQEVVVANQIDVLSATVTGNKSSNAYTGVTLDFKHALAQIEIKAKNSNTTGYTVKVLGVKLCRVNDEGDMTFQSVSTDLPTWNNLTGSKSFMKQGSEAKELTNQVQSIMFGNDNFLMLPQSLTAWDGSKADATGSYLAVLCQIYDNTQTPQTQIFPNEAGKYGFSAVPIGTKWEVGHKYVYTLDFFGAGAGAGQVDPDPGNAKADPSDPNPGTGDSPIDTTPTDGENNPGDGGGNPIIPDAKSPIKFTVTITDWTNEAGDNSVIDL